MAKKPVLFFSILEVPVKKKAGIGLLSVLVAVAIFLTLVVLGYEPDDRLDGNFE